MPVVCSAVRRNFFLPARPPHFLTGSSALPAPFCAGAGEPLSGNCRSDTCRATGDIRRPVAIPFRPAVLSNSRRGFADFPHGFPAWPEAFPDGLDGCARSRGMSARPSGGFPRWPGRPSRSLGETSQPPGRPSRPSGEPSRASGRSSRPSGIGVLCRKQPQNPKIGQFYPVARRGWAKRDPARPHPRATRVRPDHLFPGGPSPIPQPFSPFPAGLPPCSGRLPPCSGGLPPCSGGLPPCSGRLPPCSEGLPPFLEGCPLVRRGCPLFWRAAPLYGKLAPFPNDLFPRYLCRFP